MDSELSNYLTNLIIKETGFKIKHLEMENLSILKDKSTRDNGKMTGLLEQDTYNLKMGLLIKDSSIKATNTVSESIHGRIKKLITKETGNTM